MLEKNTFVVKEHVKLISTSNTYDILDAESGAQLGTAQENIGVVKQLLRFVLPKQIMSTVVEVREKPDDQLVFSIRRGPYLFRSRVEVLDANGALVGYYVSKFFTIGGGFHIYDKDDKHFAEIKGKWTGFNYRFLSPDGKVEMGQVSKKLSLGSLVKDLFTSADTYAVQVSPELTDEPMSKMLLLAAALAIDTIYKEENRGGVGLGDLGGE
ncbi:oxidoreductase [bacterium]|nr:oxidoreductase [bacterium]